MKSYPNYSNQHGAFMVVQVSDIDDQFSRLKSAGIRSEQEITDQPWAHRSFSVIEPNGLIIFFFSRAVLRTKL